MSDNRASPTPWALWLRVAAQEFSLSPNAFWDLSLWEWRALNAGRDRPQLSDFSSLFAAFPDHRSHD